MQRLFPSCYQFLHLKAYYYKYLHIYNASNTYIYIYFKLIIYIFKKNFPSNFASLATAYWEALGISETLD